MNRNVDVMMETSPEMLKQYAKIGMFTCSVIGAVVIIHVVKNIIRMCEYKKTSRKTEAK
jgi:hypothetical protein